jgi:hypothetical protein
VFGGRAEMDSARDQGWEVYPKPRAAPPSTRYRRCRGVRSVVPSLWMVKLAQTRMHRTQRKIEGILASDARQEVVLAPFLERLVEELSALRHTRASGADTEEGRALIPSGGIG